MILEIIMMEVKVDKGHWQTNQDIVYWLHQRAVGGLGYLSSIYNRIRLGSNPRQRTMNIEEVIKTCRPVLHKKTSKGDDRCFFEDEINKILYIFGPSYYFRTGFPKDDKEYIEVDERYYRPTEVDQLLGDYSKAKQRLGWEPKTSVYDLIDMMAEYDFELGRRDRIIEIHDKKLNPSGSSFI